MEQPLDVRLDLDEEEDEVEEEYVTDVRQSRFPAHADVPVVPFQELPAGMWVQFRSLCD